MFNQGDVSVFSGKCILITGGTGTLGQALVQRILDLQPKRLIVFSRDECKQNEMRQRWPDHDGSPMRYFLGDVRDLARLRRAFRGVDIVIHAAALKQVPACEYNPSEAVSTNVIGTQNIVEAAIDQGVHQVLLISTDKAVAPANTYGATKLMAERICIQANAYAASGPTRIAVCRYGNVIGSRGSIVPLFREQAASGVITITDERMTRFWITLEQALDLIEHSLQHMTGGEIFVPKLPTVSITDIASAVAPGCKYHIVGIRPGEKLHETLISVEEGRHTVDVGSTYIILPEYVSWTHRQFPCEQVGPIGWSYRSDENPWHLSPEEMRQLIHARHARTHS